MCSVAYTLGLRDLKEHSGHAQLLTYLELLCRRGGGKKARKKKKISYLIRGKKENVSEPVPLCGEL